MKRLNYRLAAAAVIWRDRPWANMGQNREFSAKCLQNVRIRFRGSQLVLRVRRSPGGQRERRGTESAHLEDTSRGSSYFGPYPDKDSRAIQLPSGMAGILPLRLA